MHTFFELIYTMSAASDVDPLVEIHNQDPEPDHSTLIQRLKTLQQKTEEAKFALIDAAIEGKPQNEINQLTKDLDRLVQVQDKVLSMESPNLPSETPSETPQSMADLIKFDFTLFHSEFICD